MTESGVSSLPEELLASGAVEALADRWRREAAGDDRVSASEAAAPFAFAFADGVLRPIGTAVAAASLRGIAAEAPATTPWRMRTALRLGGLAAPVLPVPIVPVARIAGRAIAASYVVDARPRRLAAELDRLRSAGLDAAVEPFGDAIVGDGGTRRRLSRLTDLVARPEVDRVSISIDDLAAFRSPWDFDGTVDDLVEGLRPLARAALAERTALDLTIARFRHLDLGVAIFTRLLEDPELARLDAGIALPMGVAGALGVVAEVHAWAVARADADGGPVRIRLVDGADLDAERAEAARDGWPVAAFEDPIDATASLLRGLDAVVRDDESAVRLELATTDEHVLAFAWLLAGERGATDRFSVVLPYAARAGALAESLRRDIGAVRLTVPVSFPDEFDAAAALLAGRRASVPRGHVGDAGDAFAAAVSRAGDPSLATPRRTQDRRMGPSPATPRLVRDPAPSAEDGLTQAVLGIARDAPEAAGGVVFGGERFVETAVFSEKETPAAGRGIGGLRRAAPTDPALETNREWVRSLRRRLADADRIDAAPPTPVETVRDADAVVDAAREAARSWAAVSASERALAVAAVATAVDAARDSLVTIAAAETGTPLPDVDADVDAAIDAAAFVAASARELDHVGGAVFLAPRVTLVATDALASLADTVTGVVSALATGSSVLLRAMPGALRTARALADVLWRAGVAHGLLTVVSGPDSDRILAEHPGVDRAALVGARRMESRFRGWRPDLVTTPGSAGRGVIVVTPSADVDLAVTAIVRSAFTGRRAGAVAVILVGSMGRSRVFARQLADATRSLRVGLPDDPRAVIGPVAEVPVGDSLTAATVLGDGEAWLVEPAVQERDDEFRGRLWSPGVRVGVESDAPLVRAETSLPVLGILSAGSLSAAVELQEDLRGVDVALHTRDPQDLARWLGSTTAGSLWVNRPIGASRDHEHPRAAGRSGGAAFALGGPNHLIGWGSWRPSVAAAPSPTLHLRGLDSRITAIVEAAQPSLDYESFEWVRRAALSDAVAWDREFGRVRDLARLGVERNLFRYRPADVEIRTAADAPWRAVVRTIVAAVRAGSAFVVSGAEGMPGGVRRALGDLDVPVRVETDEEWLARAVVMERESRGPRRIRIVGAAGTAEGLRRALATAIGAVAEVAVFADEVTTASRIELLPFLAEQSISIAARRDGRPDAWSEAVI